MAPTKKSAKANAEPSKHNIMSFFGSAQSQGATGKATGSLQSEGKPKGTLTKVESDDQEGGKAKRKVKCATF
jgi:hypothetical protein